MLNQQNTLVNQPGLILSTNDSENWWDSDRISSPEVIEPIWDLYPNFQV